MAKPGDDLCLVHQAIGTDFCTEEDFKDSWSKFALSESCVERFWEDGYLLNVPLLTHQQCDLIIKDVEALFAMGDDDPRMELMYEYHRNQSGDPNNVLMHTLGHWRVFHSFHDIAFMPQITVHIALEDQTLENGTLHYISGSHRWTRDGGSPLPVTDFNFKDMESILTILTDKEKEEFKPVPSLLKKGEASFHHPLAVHGSFGNRSDGPRRATVLNYFADGTLSNTDGDLLTPNNITIPKGEKMGGPFFPLVYTPPLPA